MQYGYHGCEETLQVEIGRLAKDQEETRRQLDESAKAAADSAAKQEELAAALRAVKVIILTDNGTAAYPPLMPCVCSAAIWEC